MLSTVLFFSGAFVMMNVSYKEKKNRKANLSPVTLFIQ